MQRSMVDLPEPDGPAMTITSPRATREVHAIQDDVVPEGLMDPR